MNAEVLVTGRELKILATHPNTSLSESFSTVNLIVDRVLKNLPIAFISSLITSFLSILKITKFY